MFTSHRPKNSEISGSLSYRKTSFCLPHTRRKDDELRSLNATEDNVYRLASNAKRLGVNLVWVPGSGGSFKHNCRREETLAKALGEGWKGTWDIRRPRRQQLRQKSRDLAMHAASVGANAIASVPPFYLFEPATTDANIDNVLGSKRNIYGSPNLPFLYTTLFQIFFKTVLQNFCRRPTQNFPTLLV